MGICERLRSGQDISCLTPARKYFQQVVLVNRDEVDFSRIVTSYVDVDGNFICRNRVYFKLKNLKTGFRYTANENGNSIFGIVEKTVSDGIPQYSHSINIILAGVDEQTKCLLKQFDGGDYFAAVQYYDGVVEIYGFEYGLTSSNWNYDPANLSGGAIIKLNSLADALEDEPPFVYATQVPNMEITDFNNNFANNTLDILGDFNDDYNFDFNSD